MAEHTPGPWHPDPQELADEDPEYGIYERGGIRVAAVDAEMVEQGQAVADARLIAAAPDLLAALRGLVSLSTRLLKSGEGACYDPGGNGYMQQARAAIDKAAE